MIKKELNVIPQFKEITPDKARELIDNSDHIVYSNYKYGYQLAEANAGELVEANIVDHNIRFFIGSPYNHTPVVVEPWFDEREYSFMEVRWGNIARNTIICCIDTEQE